MDGNDGRVHVPLQVFAGPDGREPAVRSHSGWVDPSMLDVVLEANQVGVEMMRLVWSDLSDANPLWGAVEELWKGLQQRYGGEAILPVMTTWIDSMAVHNDVPYGLPEYAVAADVAGPEVTRQARWACRMIAARFAKRNEQMVGIANELVGEIEQGRFVFELLQICIATMQQKDAMARRKLALAAARAAAARWN